MELRYEWKLHSHGCTYSTAKLYNIHKTTCKLFRVICQNGTACLASRKSMNTFAPWSWAEGVRRNGRRNWVDWYKKVWFVCFIIQSDSSGHRYCSMNNSSVSMHISAEIHVIKDNQILSGPRLHSIDRYELSNGSSTTGIVYSCGCVNYLYEL